MIGLLFSLMVVSYLLGLIAFLSLWQLSRLAPPAADGSAGAVLRTGHNVEEQDAIENGVKTELARVPRSASPPTFVQAPFIARLAVRLPPRTGYHTQRSFVSRHSVSLPPR